MSKTVRSCGDSEAIAIQSKLSRGTCSPTKSEFPDESTTKYSKFERRCQNGSLIRSMSLAGTLPDAGLASKTEGSHGSRDEAGRGSAEDCRNWNHSCVACR